jgi:hypothetical protein
MFMIIFYFFLYLYIFTSKIYSIKESCLFRCSFTFCFNSYYNLQGNSLFLDSFNLLCYILLKLVKFPFFNLNQIKIMALKITIFTENYSKFIFLLYFLNFILLNLFLHLNPTFFSKKDYSLLNLLYFIQF